MNFRAGDRVNCGGALGYIVDGASGACFTVLFDEDSPYKGGRLVVHPSDIESATLFIRAWLKARAALAAAPQGGKP